jgi:putative membrane protein insertion efficiency factor
VLLLAAVCAGAGALNARTLALRGIHVYQRTLEPLAARTGARCRFTPSCSRYAEIVVARDGVIVGGWETLKRVARCGPWTRPGTVDRP